jgi:hypothetical protein
MNVRRIIAASILPTTVWFLSIDSALSQSACDAVLTKDIQINSSSGSSRDQATFGYFCSHEFNEFENTYSGKASFQYKLVGGKGEYNQGNYRQSQRDLCTAFSTKDHQEAFQFYALRDASQGAIAAW